MKKDQYPAAKENASRTFRRGGTGQMHARVGLAVSPEQLFMALPAEKKAVASEWQIRIILLGWASRTHHRGSSPPAAWPC
jgi:hypothetical protein